MTLEQQLARSRLTVEILETRQREPNWSLPKQPCSFARWMGYMHAGDFTAAVCASEDAALWWENSLRDVWLERVLIARAAAEDNLELYHAMLESNSDIFGGGGHTATGVWPWEFNEKGERLPPDQVVWPWPIRTRRGHRLKELADRLNRQFGYDVLPSDAR